MTEVSKQKTRTRYRDEDIGKLKAALEQGQRNYEHDAKSKSMRGLISALRDDVIKLRERGYTTSMIANMIRDGGFKSLASSTLSRYISEVSARKRRRKRSVERKPARAPTPPPQALSNPAQSSATSARSGEFPVIADKEDL